MKNWNLAMIGLALIGTAGCGGSNENSNYLPMTRKNATPEAVEKATKSLTAGKGAKATTGANDFGFKLFKEVAKDGWSTNEFISPISVATALAMTANGAAGNTREAFEKVLGVENTLPNDVNQAYKDLQTTLVGSDGKVDVSMANGLWIDKEFELKREFSGRVNEYFGAIAQTVEMSHQDTPRAINDWVKRETADRVPKLFDKLEDGTVAILVNAVYFKGKWTEPFAKTSTKDGEFTGFDGKSKSVSMMSRSGEQIDYFKSEKFAAVRLPYGDGRISMTILLPHERSGFAGVAAELSSKNWAVWAGRFKPSSGMVSIPKWRAESTYDLKPPLGALGLALALDPQKADFSGMADVKPGELYINKVVHKTFVEVDEEGTEAAGATGVGIGLTSAPMPSERFEFIANRPFFYAISDKRTGAILFFGTYGKP